jgi:hypothetical protein
VLIKAREFVQFGRRRGRLPSTSNMVLAMVASLSCPAIGSMPLATPAAGSYEVAVINGARRRRRGQDLGSRSPRYRRPDRLPGRSTNHRGSGNPSTGAAQRRAYLAPAPRSASAPVASLAGYPPRRRRCCALEWAQVGHPPGLSRPPAARSATHVRSNDTASTPGAWRSLRPCRGPGRRCGWDAIPGGVTGAGRERPLRRRDGQPCGTLGERACEAPVRRGAGAVVDGGLPFGLAGGAAPPDLALRSAGDRERINVGVAGRMPFAGQVRPKRAE